MTKASDPSLTARRQILAAALKHVPFEGWTAKSLRLGVKDLDMPEGAEELHFPGGPLDVISFWSEECDREMFNAMAETDLKSLRIRDRVTLGVVLRLEAIGRHDEAGRRALTRLALPDAIGLAPKLIWNTSDAIWRALNDPSTDFNYYTKRATLSGVVSSTMPVWLGDTSDEKKEARAFLDRRVDNVMQIEKVKSKVRNLREKLPQPWQRLSKMRYGGTPR